MYCQIKMIKLFGLDQKSQMKTINYSDFVTFKKAIYFVTDRLTYFDPICQIFLINFSQSNNLSMLTIH